MAKNGARRLRRTTDGRSVSDEIEDLAEQRHAAWSARDVKTAKVIEEQLDRLYAEKRQHVAPNGTDEARERVKKLAVVESELDRLMQP